MITIGNRTLESDAAVVGYICGGMQAILNSHLTDTEKVVAIQELKNEVDMAMMLS